MLDKMQIKKLLPGAIRSSDPKSLRQAPREACLLYEDLYYFLQEMILVYQHTPHRGCNRFVTINTNEM